ncbi:MCE family protein [Actinomadura madurae]|uniref:MCE family protein n=1 Tax=Actinomadura madurae TaxID=1993 RepID=UPI0020263C94|nr:MCE family protein [Actinomadura madurae]MCP9953760.1 MCE family protein [Actinomadura madurae]MCP9970514.1 MCE family protein [Actinomadura madurae]MCP9982989.1 MCE family protein [Actinomadura madurae]MCQ0005456.1 MCE family protein [Actinomadura madurae]MCQ0019229.1 MCE family protein [Actinomadura madurae]
MTRRLTINLVVFGVLAAVMVVWAFNNVIRFDFIDRPYNITVEFESSPGLHPNFEVDYLGLRIGKIDSVRLERNKVVVKLDIERGVKIPQGVTAAAARKSAVGEPVVELTPGAGKSDAPAMKPGTVIPVSQTKVPPKYGDLFGAVIDSLKAINPDDAKVLTHELAEGWAGREDSLRQIINGGDDLTQTFAENTELLDGLTKDLGRITHVLNQNRGSLGAGVDNLAALTAALSQVRGQIAELRDRGPGLLKTVNGLLDKTAPDFGCTVDMLGNLGVAGYNPDYLSDLRQILVLAPQLQVVLNNVIGRDQGKPVLNVVFQVTTKRLAALEYKYPLAQPRVNKVPTCPGGRTPAVTEQKPYKAKNPGETIPTHDPALNEQGVQARKAANNDGSSGGPPVWLVYIPPVIALLILIRVMMGSVPVVSRLSRRRRNKD